MDKNGYLHLMRQRGRRVGALTLTAALLLESFSGGAVLASAAEIPEITGGEEAVVESGSLKQADYTDAGTDVFPIGETKTYKFGTAGNVKSFTAYSKDTGFGWDKLENVKLKSGRDYIAGTNYLDSTAHTWEYPRFVVDVPTGVYDVTIIQGTNGTEKAVNGAYVEGNMYSVRWSSEDFATSYAMPSESSWIYTEPGEEKVSNVKTAVADGQLTIDFATSLTDENVSGMTYIKEVRVTRAEQITEPSAAPTLRFIGDSTLAKYPPEDGGVWTPIPERTGWGEEFSMGKFVDDSVVLVNKAVAGSSIKSWVYDGYLNDFLLTSHPGDTVIIEGGINDSADGRRKSTSAEFEQYLQYFVDVLQAFGLDVIISSGTKSTADYTTPMKTVSEKNNLHYVDLITKWNSYKSSVNLTVDGTHLNRLGGILAAQMVAYDIKDLKDLSISGHIKDIPVNEAAPTAKVENLRIKKQGTGFISLQWDMPESTIYNENQLIGEFHIYRQKKDASDPAEKVYTQSAMLSADMTQPQLFATFVTPEEGDYVYTVKAAGTKGEGPASDPLEVPEYNPSVPETLSALVEKYSNQMYDGTIYSVESAVALSKALEEAKKYLADPATTSEQYQAQLTSLNAAIDGLKKNPQTFLETTFEDEELKSSAWGMTGNQATYMSAIMDLDGNRLLKMETGSQSGERTLQKVFEGADALDAAVELVEFEWYPGIPDTRNCTEIEFFSAKAGERVLSLKTAKIDNEVGHIGYVVGNYPNDNSYLIGNGFHEYKDSTAVDLGLPSDAWYNVKIVFHFKNGTADLYIQPRDEAGAKVTAVKDIKISTTKNSIQTMKFLLKRGRKDGDTGNDLSLLWTTYLDNFGMYYAQTESTTGKADCQKALDSYRAKTANIDSSLLTSEKVILAESVAKIMEQDAGFFTAADYTYASNVLKAAVSEIPELKNVTEISFPTPTLGAGAGETVELTANLTPADANEAIVYTSSDETVATVSGSAGKAYVTAKQNGTATITATGAVSGVSASIEVTVSGQIYPFGKGRVNAYSAEVGYGFMNYSYPNAAEGWKEVEDPYDGKKSVYIRRALVQEPGTDYVNTSASTNDYLAIRGQVWNELPDKGRDEDKITYENTAAFAVDLPNGNYHVTVDFANPDSEAADVMVKAEDIFRYASGDHASSEIAVANVPAGGTAAAGFDIALTDGQLNLRFEQNSVASGAPEAAKNVYVKSVSVRAMDSKAAGAKKPTIHFAGDSTVQSYYAAGYRRSWAQNMYTLFGTLDESTAAKNEVGYDFFETEKVIFRNYARDARSTRSFLEEGRLNEMLLNINAGDYVFMQFAHNDDNAPRVNRYVDVAEFKQRISNLNKALTERGATLVLVTPIAIEGWDDDGNVDHRFDDYRLAMMEQGAAENIPVLDLMGATMALIDAMGSENTKKLGVYKDTVHTTETGARMFTGLMGNLLRASKDEKLAPVLALMTDAVNNNPISIECDGTLILDPACAADSTRLKITAENAPIGKRPVYISDERVVQYKLNKLVATGEGTAIVTTAYTAGDLGTADCTAYTAYKVIRVKAGASDLTKLMAAIAQAGKYNESEYTAESYAAVKAALDAANALSFRDDQAVIDAAAESLNAAIAALVKKPEEKPDNKPVQPDRTALDAAIKAAESKVKAEYTAESFAKLESALQAAKALGADATEAQITEAAAALNRAINALVPAKKDDGTGTVKVPEKGEGFTADDGKKYKVTKSNEVSYVAQADKKAMTSAVIPDTAEVGGKVFKVTAVDSKAFEKATKLKTVNIGKNVTSIGASAFSGCTSLTAVKFKGTKCKTIGTKAFKGAKKLKSITLPNSVQKIGNNAFESCSVLTTVTIGTGLKEIGSNAFNNDKKLGKIVIKSSKLTKVGKNALKGTKKNIKIKVPKKKLNAYKKLFKNKGQKKFKVEK